MKHACRSNYLVFTHNKWQAFLFIRKRCRLVFMDELKILLSWGACTLLLCGLLLWFRRDYGDRSRRYLCYTWIMAGLAFLVRLVAVELGRPIAGRILPPENLSGGLILVLMLYLYPIEVINKNWFTLKRLFQLFVPGIALIIVLLFVCPHCRELESFSDIWLHIGEFNVWFRVAALFLCLIPYTLMLYFIPYNWRECSVSSRGIIRYAFFIQLIGIFFILFMLTGSAVFSAFQLTAAICVAIWMTYQELFIRFGVPQEEAPEVFYSTPLLQDSEVRQKEINPLIEELYRLMDEEEIWRNPDMNLPELALRLATNRSYLSKAIQEAGFKNYSDLINRRRILEFLKLADSGQVTSVQDTFFQVGFRSRETALRCFKKYTGVLPTDYLRNGISSLTDL